MKYILLCQMELSTGNSFPFVSEYSDAGFFLYFFGSQLFLSKNMKKYQDIC
jgi:hypothetical protein